jgi:hypothetical protein
MIRSGTLGTVSYTAAGHRVQVHEQSHDDAGTCRSQDNTASFVTSDTGTGSASKTVKLCVGADLTASRRKPSFDRKCVEHHEGSGQDADREVGSRHGDVQPGP